MHPFFKMVGKFLVCVLAMMIVGVHAGGKGPRSHVHSCPPASVITITQTITAPCPPISSSSSTSHTENLLILSIHLHNFLPESSARTPLHCHCRALRLSYPPPTNPSLQPSILDRSRSYYILSRSHRSSVRMSSWHHNRIPR